MTAQEAVDELHARCAVYTAPATASRLLDDAGWTACADLASSTLLEPCVGEGAIVVEAAKRLLESLATRRVRITARALAGRLVGFELHAATAHVARAALVDILVDWGVGHKTAVEVAGTWITTADFLLEKPRRATHVVANPPYIRWSKLPSALAEIYRKRLPPLATRGDLAVAFLDRMLEWLPSEGKLVALVSDRWMYAQYGDEFVRDCIERGWATEVLEERPVKPFVRSVGAYSAIVRMSSPRASGASGRTPRAAARALHSRLTHRHGILADTDCRIRVGPALGCGDAFVVSAGEVGRVESTLLRPLITRTGLVDGAAIPGSTLVAAPWDAQGRLFALEEVPLFAAWIGERRDRLAHRSCIKAGRHWWRTIDAIGTNWANAPKLLVPELCREAKAYLDVTDALPAHSIYAIWPGDWPIETLQKVLNAGLLQLTAEAEAPALQQGWFRLYRRFLLRTPLPRWLTLSSRSRAGLASPDEAKFGTAFRTLFDFAPGGLPTFLCG